eukprot:CAMPEP_0197585094 /NCGR_PEP_ID=MMETSP1326-20131121/7501_1 /TAXON_ID=1155430 /ORGANISM="Genus nov. species nov., Strain RCC2288" /LENGTH=31 /DNA_ID= /DNA_START= /DNA_END= /DNA_ORIENTATION=
MPVILVELTTAISRSAHVAFRGNPSGASPSP